MDIESSHTGEGENFKTQENNSLTYEETPPITPTKEPQPEMFPPPKPKRKSGSAVTTVIIFIILFIVGFWFSGTIRKYIGDFLGGTTKEVALTTPTPKATEGVIIPTTIQDAFGTWKSYQVLNGRTRIAYEGISFKLPPDVLAPICDGSSCGSQGTYLSGGTRFTVALRGAEQVLPDFRGKVISDLKGTSFTVNETRAGGRSATEFVGAFTGTTVGGYVFSQMRGFMIPITDAMSLEINHFSPNGIVSDFTKDDVLFDDIIRTLVLPVGMIEKGGPTSTGTPSKQLLLPIGTPSATPIIGE